MYFISCSFGLVGICVIILFASLDDKEVVMVKEKNKEYFFSPLLVGRGPSSKAAFDFG